MAHLPRRMPALAVASLLAVSLTACSGSGDDDSSTTESSPSASASEEASPSASPTADKSPKKSPKASPSKVAPSGATEPTPTGLPTPGGGTPSAALVKKILTPEELPGLNDQTVWSEKSTGTEGETPFGDCQKSSLTDIGATDVVVRTYDAHGSQAGAQLIATFPDAKSAWRANEVLKSWREDCRARIDAPVKKVGPLTDVQAQRGTAQSYLVQFGQKGAEEHNFHGVGITRVGKTLSIITVDVLGQDYNYLPGEEPASLAASAAAGKL